MYVQEVMKSMANQQKSFQITQSNLILNQITPLTQLMNGIELDGVLYPGEHPMNWEDFGSKTYNVEEVRNDIERYQAVGLDFRNNTEWLKLYKFIYHSSSLDGQMKEMAKKINHLAEFFDLSTYQNLTYNFQPYDPETEIVRIY